MDLKELYSKQISLTEWFEKMGHAQTGAMRAEDNEKRERLRVLNERIGLPFDRPYQCAASDIADRTPAFVAYLDAHRDELCALRLIPLDPSLPKLRMRGMSVGEVVEKWFPEQGVDLSKYRADFVPHPADHLWSTIFVVSEDGVTGEIIRGSHNQLTQGFHDAEAPITFTSKDFSTWELSEENEEARAYLADTVAMLRVDGATTREELMRDLDARFANNHLVGYFETVASSAFGTWFIDYNRLLAQEHLPPPPNLPLVKGEGTQVFPLLAKEGTGEVDGLVSGRTGSRGSATGRVRVVLADELDTATINDGDILVCDMTTPDHLPLMQKAAAIVTDLGGILTHAAIVCRELGKPCVVGTKNATQTFRDGDVVEVDADHGTIRRV